MVSYSLAKNLEKLDKEDAFFEDNFKELVKNPENYLNFLENLLLQDFMTLFSVCNRSSEDLCYYVNRICYHFINNLGLNKYETKYREDYYIYLQRLINIIENTGNDELKSKYFLHLFQRNSTVTDLEAPTLYDSLKKILEKYENKSKGQQENKFQFKQRLSKRLMRYPHLYEHCMLSGGVGNYNFKKLAKEKKAVLTREFGAKLYRYLRTESSREQNQDLMSSITTNIVIAKNNKIDNPTGLQKQEIYDSIGYFKNQKSYKDTATVVKSKLLSGNLQQSKKVIHQSIITMLPSEYRGSFFFHKLMIKLQTFLSQHDNTITDPEKTHQIVNFILKFLVINETDFSHYVFLDMLSNLGVKKTLHIFLQLIYFCPELDRKNSRHQEIENINYLEERLACLFKHYENYDDSEMTWLVRFLEHFNIATALHFDGLSLVGIELPSSS